MHKLVRSLFILGASLNAGCAEDAEADDEAGGEEEEKEYTSNFVWGSTIFGIFTFLVLVTVVFERGQEFLLDASTPKMRPVVKQMFAEMTILGFLSIATIIISAGGTLEKLSEVIFDEGETLVELLETVHYILFLVMVVFIVEVMLLVVLGNGLSVKWHAMNEWVCDMEELASSSSGAVGHAALKVDEAGFVIGDKNKVLPFKLHDGLRFWAMRREFLLDRNALPPHVPEKKEKRVPDNFAYGQYLLESLSEDLVEMVDVSWQTWLVLEMVAALWCGILAAYYDEVLGFVKVWIAFEYLLLGGYWWFYAHCKWIETMICCPRLGAAAAAVKASGGKQPGGGGGGGGDPSLSLLSDPFLKGMAVGGDDEEGGGDASLPGWAKRDDQLGAYGERRVCVKMLCGTAPNKMHSLFLFQQKGHEGHVFLCRLMILLQAIYVSVLCVVFLPAVLDRAPAWELGLYAAVALVPVLGFVYLSKHAVSLAIHVGSVGTFRSKRMVHMIVREQKAARAVALLETLHCVRRQMVQASVAAAGEGALPEIGGRASTLRDPAEAAARKAHHEKVVMEMPKAQRDAISRTFDLYDTDGSGTLDPNELRGLMASLGRPLEEEHDDHAGDHASALLLGMDINGSGEVDKFEFLAWMAIIQVRCAARLGMGVCPWRVGVGRERARFYKHGPCRFYKRFLAFHRVRAFWHRGRCVCACLTAGPLQPRGAHQ